MYPPVVSFTFIEAIRSYFKNYVNFSGRATRKEYWYAVLFLFIITTILSFIGNEIILSVFALATLLPSLGVAWRRLHDIGRSGAYYFFIFIPLVGAIILIVWFCLDSGPDNQYGPRKTAWMI